MNFDDLLYEAVVRNDGGEMIAILKDAAASGLPRIDADQSMIRLLNRLSNEGREKEEDFATDIGNITQNNCQEQYRIWPLD